MTINSITFNCLLECPFCCQRSNEASVHHNSEDQRMNKILNGAVASMTLAASLAVGACGLFNDNQPTSGATTGGATTGGATTGGVTSRGGIGGSGIDGSNTLGGTGDMGE
jgi:hypothetical protein